MTQASLEDVVRRMARRLESRKDTATQDDHVDILSEVDSYKSLDPVLAGLHKDYLNARTLYTRLLKDRGDQDPMTCVAADRLESCLGTFETRLIELRQDTAMKRSALDRLKAARAEAERLDQESRIASLSYWRKMEEFYDEETLTELMETRRSDDRFFRLMLFVLAMQNATHFARGRHRVSHLFKKASSALNLNQDDAYAAAS